MTIHVRRKRIVEGEGEGAQSMALLGGAGVQARLEDHMVWACGSISVEDVTDFSCFPKYEC